MTAMRLRVGPLLLCTAVALYRAIWLSWQLTGFQALDVGFLLLADIPVIGLIAALTFLEARLRHPWRLVPIAATVVLVAFYLADVLVVLELNARLQLSDLSQFGRELWLVRGFVSVVTVAALVAVAASFLVRLAVPPAIGRLVPVLGIVLVMLPLAVGGQRIPSHLQKYAGSILLLTRELWGNRWQPISRYRPGDFAAYQRDYDALFDAPIARTGKDIVLVIVESLSAVDSARTSGVRAVLPRLDDLSREGMLFQNFFANFEASEGGIVSLTSGVPPLHFPTASTNTFAEYSMQRGITATFRRNGYRCEFLTNVPLQFISMDRYATSPAVGFTAAAGQHEIARYQGAPRYAFESPPDHLLYEELLARLDARDAGRRQPVLMVLVTASSHRPYVDPRGVANTERQVWSYVEDELRWLHDQLAARRFFDNGMLVITGDHRRMTPIRAGERQRYGESAKARVPLIVMGAGVPRGVVDTRFFQQADLLRMLDRAIQPGASLSPFIIWVERYVFVFGVASNASNIEIFEAGNEARQGFKLKLKGAEIDWLTRPANPLAIERAIHRQRAVQQAVRAAVVRGTNVRFGRGLRPSAQTRGVLVGVSADRDLGRDPDDPKNGLRTFPLESLALDKILARAGNPPAPFTVTGRAFLSIPADGEYWFSMHSDAEGCLAIDEEIVLACEGGFLQGSSLLTAGVHRFDVRYAADDDTQRLDLTWLPPGAKTFAPFPYAELLLPEQPR